MSGELHETRRLEMLDLNELVHQRAELLNASQLQCVAAVDSTAQEPKVHLL